MGIAAENVAQQYNISKNQQDRYALLSHKRSWEAFEKDGLKKKRFLFQT